MTRKDFEFIAATLRMEREAVSTPERETLRGVALTFAARLAATNPGFDRARFLKACGVEG